MNERELAHQQTRASQVQVRKRRLGAEGPAMLRQPQEHAHSSLHPAAARLGVAVPPTSFRLRSHFLGAWRRAGTQSPNAQISKTIIHKLDI